MDLLFTTKSLSSSGGRRDASWFLVRYGDLKQDVFRTSFRSRVGVIELLTSSKHPSFAYEVQQFQRALKTQNLTCRQVSDAPVSDVIYEGRGNELENIFGILSTVCDYYRLPLAQTWAVSSLSTIAAHEQVLRMSCNSFDSRCLGKVCMAFLSSGSCFCEDVTKLNEDEYPLVHFARMHGLTSSFAIHLHSVKSNDDYVLEFFLPSHIQNIKHVLNLVQVLKQYFDQVTSRFELGDKSFIEAVGPPMDLCVNIEPDIMDTFIDVPDEWSSTSVSTTFTEGGETNSLLKPGKKCKRGSKKTVYEGKGNLWTKIAKGFGFRNHGDWRIAEKQSAKSSS
ncbi:hypothetical protein Tco_1061308 [Tanacetum coccineum]